MGQGGCLRNTCALEKESSADGKTKELPKKCRSKKGNIFKKQKKKTSFLKTEKNQILKREGSKMTSDFQAWEMGRMVVIVTKIMMLEMQRS